MELLEMPMFEEYMFWEHLQKRRIILNQQIDPSVVERVMLQILKFNEQDDENPDAERKPIELYINSPGGSVYETLVLCDIIKQSKTPVYITVFGYAASGAALITIAGHKRRAYPGTSFLIHQASTAESGKLSEINESIKHANRQMGVIKDYILANTKITPKKYKQMEKAEWWLLSGEALELGIVDEIIGK
jgi:ATP-dependent Clp protease protease subunit